MNTMKCDCCGLEVDESTTSSCAIGGIELSDFFPVSSERMKKLCTFDDQFYCINCMDNNICKSCSKELTAEEKELLKEKI